MSKADAVVQHLPLLRRYARALTGNQVSGDAYVAATLEALVKEPDLLEAPDPHRVTLFRLFSTIWNSISVNDARELPTNEMAGDRNLSQITPKPRQAFLLVSVEGFSEDHAARILDVDAPTLRQLLEESGRELAAQIATDVLIIEDEALIALDLQALVENLGHKVIGVARTKAEALAIGRKSTVGLILADIQLADGSSGLDAVNDLLNTFEVPVIFITAYPERFLTG
jgi:DNA-directed RNA polymerase specialized sigma24 family protein